MNSFLQLIGWRKHPTKKVIPLFEFRAWQTWLALAVAIVVIGTIGKLS